jgi:pimeloyl-ACP methyl ester carboxylesterase
MILNSIEAGAAPAGSGPSLILMHGLFGAAKNLGVIARALAADARVVSLDLRNHGDSPRAAGMDYATMAADVAETIAALEITSAMVVGHSMGGKTAMALALSQPALVQKLVVMDIAPVSYNHAFAPYVAAMQGLALTPALTRQDANAALAEAIPEAAMRAFLLNNLILGAAPRWRLALPEIAAAMPDLTAWRDPPDAKPYPRPALFLRGATSGYVRDDAWQTILDKFPAAVQKTIADAGHWLHAEQPDLVIAALKEFLFQ